LGSEQGDTVPELAVVTSPPPTKRAPVVEPRSWGPGGDPELQPPRHIDPNTMIGTARTDLDDVFLITKLPPM
jgi:hypothetical protein